MDEPEIGKATKALGQVLATAAGLAIGGPAGAVIAAAVSDAAVEATGKAWDEITAARRRSAAAMVALAAAELETGPDQLVMLALAGQERAALLADALAAAAHTFYSRKVEALAKAVANGLRDDVAAVDEARLVVHALADLEEPHVKVLLDFLIRPNEPVTTNRTQWTIRIPGLSEAAISHLLSMLEARGLIQVDAESRRPNVHLPYSGKPSGMPAREGDTMWVPTRFGQTCLRYLLEHHEPSVRAPSPGQSPD